MYMTKQQLKKALDNGHFDDVTKQLRTYGTIVEDKQWDEEEGYYKGSHRVMHILHYGMKWELHMQNGETTRAGYELA